MLGRLDRDAFEGQKGHGVPLLLLEVINALFYCLCVVDDDGVKVILHHDYHGEVVPLLPHLRSTQNMPHEW